MRDGGPWPCHIGHFSLPLDRFQFYSWLHFDESDDTVCKIIVKALLGFEGVVRSWLPRMGKRAEPNIRHVEQCLEVSGRKGSHFADRQQNESQYELLSKAGGISSLIS